MPQSSLKLLSMNPAVVQMPDRKFPGVVIQGDALNNLYVIAREVLHRAEKVDDEVLVAEARRLVKLLDADLRQYESVLIENDIELPYKTDLGIY